MFVAAVLYPAGTMTHVCICGAFQVNFFVGAFYDGVTLYGTALKETLEAGDDPLDGYTVARRMWNRTYVGQCSLEEVDFLLDDCMFEMWVSPQTRSFNGVLEKLKRRVPDFGVCCEKLMFPN